METIKELFDKHEILTRDFTRNSLFMHASSGMENKDKQIKFSEKIKSSIGLPENVNSLYDQKAPSGAYMRIYEFTIMSLCADVEYFLKDLFKIIYGIEERNTYFQKIQVVFDRLKNDFGLNINPIENDINLLIECFQIRHICTHNMGYVDQDFKDKTTSFPSYNIGDKIVVNQDDFNKYAYAYERIFVYIKNFVITA